MNWTVFQLRILLHYFAFAGDFEEGNPAFREGMCGELQEHGLLERADYAPLWRLTDKGRCFIEDGLLKTPLPTWSIPR